jgi:hypothetical protein
MMTRDGKVSTIFSQSIAISLRIISTLHNLINSPFFARKLVKSALKMGHFVGHFVGQNDPLFE